jgi:hypothetical protein
MSSYFVDGSLDEPFIGGSGEFKRWGCSSSDGTIISFSY